MRLRTLLPIIAALICAAPLSAQEKLLRVDMNIPALRLTLYEGDEILRSYRVEPLVASAGERVGPQRAGHPARAEQSDGAGETLLPASVLLPRDARIRQYRYSGLSRVR